MENWENLTKYIDLYIFIFPNISPPQNQSIWKPYLYPPLDRPKIHTQA